MQEMPVLILLTLVFNIKPRIFLSIFIKYQFDKDT